MKNFLIGILLLPALVGALVIYHSVIAEKPGPAGEELTNRIARFELVWLAMNKPKLFFEQFPQLAMNVEERHGLDERQMLRSDAFDPQFFIEHNPSVAVEMVRDRDLVGRYWLTHLDECRPSAPGFDVLSYLMRNPDVQATYGGDCRLATIHWVKWGKHEGRDGSPEPHG